MSKHEPAGHAPSAQVTDYVTVTCAATGNPVDWGDRTQHEATLDDLEAFCAEARKQGATGDMSVHGSSAGLFLIVNRA